MQVRRLRATYAESRVLVLLSAFQRLLVGQQPPVKASLGRSVRVRWRRQYNCAGPYSALGCAVRWATALGRWRRQDPCRLRLLHHVDHLTSVLDRLSRQCYKVQQGCRAGPGFL